MPLFAGFLFALFMAAFYAAWLFLFPSLFPKAWGTSLAAWGIPFLAGVFSFFSLRWVLPRQRGVHGISFKLFLATGLILTLIFRVLRWLLRS